MRAGAWGAGTAEYSSTRCLRTAFQTDPRGPAAHKPELRREIGSLITVEYVALARGRGDRSCGSTYAGVVVVVNYNGMGLCVCGWPGKRGASIYSRVEQRRLRRCTSKYCMYLYSTHFTCGFDIDWHVPCTLPHRDADIFPCENRKCPLCLSLTHPRVREAQLQVHPLPN